MKQLEYKYKDQSLTPAMCEELILEVYEGRLVERHIIMSEITKLHIERGGKQSKATDKSRMVKRALENLRKKGVAENPSRGNWRIIAQNESVIYEVDELIIENKESDNTKIDIDKEEFSADVVLGKGESAVYVYYLPTYREISKNKGKDTWACKIGRTDRNPMQRIISQSSTALPEKPEIGLIIKTDNAHGLEQAIHNILSYRNKKINTALGKEWFDTNPEEIVVIAQFIEQSTLLF